MKKAEAVAMAKRQARRAVDEERVRIGTQLRQLGMTKKQVANVLGVSLWHGVMLQVAYDGFTGAKT